MNDDSDIRTELARFQRTVATCLGIVPLLFAGQCLAALAMSKTAEGMLRDFGARMPVVTQFALSWRTLWLVVAIALPVAAVVMARRGGPVRSVIFSTGCALILFAIAQLLTYAMWAPIIQLGEVVGK